MGIKIALLISTLIILSMGSVVYAESVCDTRLNIDTGQTVSRSIVPIPFNTGDQVRFTYLANLDGTNGTMDISWNNTPVASLAIGGQFVYTIQTGGMHTYYITTSDLTAMRFDVSCVGDAAAGTSEFTPEYDNWQYGSGIALVFMQSDRIDIYDVESGSFSAGILSKGEFEILQDSPPVQNVLIKSEGLVRIYILTTGEIQFNIGPDAEGKEWVVIFPTWDANAAYGYEVIP